MTPRPERGSTVRAFQDAVYKIPFDGGLFSAYDDHSGAPASSGRAPSRSVQKIWRGGSCAFSSPSRCPLGALPCKIAAVRSPPHRPRRRHRDHQLVLTFDDVRPPVGAHSTRRSTPSSITPASPEELVQPWGYIEPARVPRTLGSGVVTGWEQAWLAGAGVNSQKVDVAARAAEVRASSDVPGRSSGGLNGSLGVV